MRLINQQTKEVVDEYLFRQRFPNTSFPINMTDRNLEGFGYVVYVKPPDPAPTQKELDAEANAAVEAEMKDAIPAIVEALLTDDKPALAKLRQEHTARKVKLK